MVEGYSEHLSEIHFMEVNLNYVVIHFSANVATSIKILSCVIASQNIKLTMTEAYYDHLSEIR